MRCSLRMVLCGLCLAVVASPGNAQPPVEPRDRSPQRSARPSTSNAAAVEAIVARMMAFDKNKDGKLTKDEITDPGLHRLFDRADANHDGIVTREELTALAQKMVAESGLDRGGRRGPGGDGFGPGPGGDFFRGPGGPGGNRGPRPPQPGQMLSPRTKELLSLSTEQEAKITALQKEVDAKLAKILTEEQIQQLKEMKRRGGDGPPPPPGF